MTQENKPIFYAKSTIIDTIKNGGWKRLLSLLFLLAVFLVFPYFSWHLFDLDWMHVCVLIVVISTILSEFIFVTKEIKIVNNKILLRKSFTKSWKEIGVDDISHITYYDTPLEKGKVFPVAEIYSIHDNGSATISFQIRKQDIYLFLSILQDHGKDVLMFEDLRNINETVYYTPIPDLKINNADDKENNHHSRSN